jgi:hypothetical protein
VQARASLPSPADVSAALQRVYARPEFRPETREGWLYRLYTWWEGVQHAFWDAVARLQILERTAPVLFWVIIGWLVVAAVAILAHLAVTARDAWRTREEAEARGAAAAHAGTRPRTAQDWDDEARRAADGGRLREAAVATYQALLLRLDSRGVVRFDPAKTPGDYRRETRRHPGAGAAFGGFLRLFEPVAFGGRSLDGGAYQRLRSAAAEAAGLV